MMSFLVLVWCCCRLLPIASRRSSFLSLRKYLVQKYVMHQAVISCRRLFPADAMKALIQTCPCILTTHHIAAFPCAGQAWIIRRNGGRTLGQDGLGLGAKRLAHFLAFFVIIRGYPPADVMTFGAMGRVQGWILVLRMAGGNGQAKQDSHCDYCQQGCIQLDHGMNPLW